MLWVNDKFGNLVQTDLQGNLLQKIQTNGRYGYHTLTQDGDLIFTDNTKKVINKVTISKNITKFIPTGDWEPISIFSSNINGDILVGMVTHGKAEVTRYNMTGKELQNIHWDKRGEKLYSYPHYITENINEDICVSDYNKHAVVVVNKLGKHRFSYTGQKLRCCPYGISTDVLGHILVSYRYSDAVHLLDKDGQFLSLLFTPQNRVYHPRSMCVDVENNLYVGQLLTNKLSVYEYLQ